MASTAAGLLVEKNRTSPTKVACRRYFRGKFSEISFGELTHAVATIGARLLDWGIKPGQVVAILSSDQQLAFELELAAQGVGAQVLQLDPRSGEVQVVSELLATGAVIAFANDQEQYDKIHDNSQQLPNLKTLVVAAPRGIRHLFDTSRSDFAAEQTLDQFLDGPSAADQGHAIGTRDPASLQPGANDRLARWQAEVERRLPVEPARVTAGQPISQAELVSGAESLISTVGVTSKDVIFVQNPLSNLNEMFLVVASTLSRGCVSHFSQDLLGGMRLVQPTLVAASPEYLSALSADVALRSEKATGLRSLALAKGLKMGSPSSMARKTGNRSFPQLFGIFYAVLAFLFLLFTVHVNDFLRVALLLLGAAATLFAMIVTGHGVANPLRVRYGLKRCRAMVASGAHEKGTQVLGALGIPLVPLTQEASK